MKEEAFIVIRRSLERHPRYGGDWSAVFVHMELSAAFQGYRKEVDGKITTIRRGQFVASRESFAEEVGLEPSVVERIWRKMRADGEISWSGRRGSKDGRLFTLHGYNERQENSRLVSPTANRTANSIGKSEEIEQQIEQRPNSDRTAIIGGQQGNKVNNNKTLLSDESSNGGYFLEEEQRAIDLYNEICGPRGFRQVNSFSTELQKALERLCPDTNEEAFREMFEQAAEERDAGDNEYNRPRGNKLIRILWANR